jgi:hypothetical protein
MLIIMSKSTKKIDFQTLEDRFYYIDSRKRAKNGTFDTSFLGEMLGFIREGAL